MSYSLCLYLIPLSICQKHITTNWLIWDMKCVILLKKWFANHKLWSTQKGPDVLHSIECLVMCSSAQYLIKYGRAIKVLPIRIIRNMLETKYGNAHRTTPDSRAIPRCCFLPYMKYPIPIEPNNTAHIIDVVLSIIFLYFFHWHIKFNRRNICLFYIFRVLYFIALELSTGEGIFKMRNLFLNKLILSVIVSVCSYEACRYHHVINNLIIIIMSGIRIVKSVFNVSMFQFQTQQV